MWRVTESSAVAKTLARAPAEIRRKWDVWLAIVQQSGPDGLRAIHGFHDEALAGQWQGRRSSRLSRSYRVIYEVNRAARHVHVIDVTKRDYRTRK